MVLSSPVGCAPVPSLAVLVTFGCQGLESHLHLAGLLSLGFSREKTFLGVIEHNDQDLEGS